MNTKQIRCILELARTQNFNRAAENLFISQPTLTYQLKAAEDEIGFAIFSRSARGASLTPAGAQFVTTLQTIQQALQAAIEQGQNFSAKYQDSIRIVLPIRSALYFLPQAIRGSVAPLGNTFIALLKNSTVAAAASVATETSTMMSEMIEYHADLIVPIFLTFAFGYVILIIPFGALTTYLSNKLAVRR